MTYQIIYSSESSTPMQMEDLEEILQGARSSNTSNDITGALVYADGVFLQILEGERCDVDALMAKISNDVRHETITVLQEAEIAGPLFKDWNMAYVSATAQQVAKWAGLDSRADIPDLLDDLRQHPPRVTQLARSILSLLASDSASASESDCT